MRRERAGGERMAVRAGCGRRCGSASRRRGMEDRGSSCTASPQTPGSPQRCLRRTSSRSLAAGVVGESPEGLRCRNFPWCRGSATLCLAGFVCTQIDLKSPAAETPSRPSVVGAVVAARPRRITCLVVIAECAIAQHVLGTQMFSHTIECSLPHGARPYPLVSSLVGGLCPWPAKRRRFVSSCAQAPPHPHPRKHKTLPSLSLSRPFPLASVVVDGLRSAADGACGSATGRMPCLVPAPVGSAERCLRVSEGPFRWHPAYEGPA